MSIALPPPSAGLATAILGFWQLVSREDFDVQRCVLLRTREKVEALESRVNELEALIGARASSHYSKQFSVFRGRPIR